MMNKEVFTYKLHPQNIDNKNDYFFKILKMKNVDFKEEKTNCYDSKLKIFIPCIFIHTITTNKVNKEILNEMESFKFIQKVNQDIFGNV